MCDAASASCDVAIDTSRVVPASQCLRDRSYEDFPWAGDAYGRRNLHLVLSIYLVTRTCTGARVHESSQDSMGRDEMRCEIRLGGGSREWKVYRVN